MFKKVLIVDDLVSINEGVVTTIQNIGIAHYNTAMYCDEAYLKLKRAHADNSPFDLLITDLSFKADYRTQRLQSGEDLIKVVKHELPELKTIVYSVEDRFQKVRHLVNNVQSNAFVCKGRRGLVELEQAIYAILDEQLYLSPQVVKALSNQHDLEVTDYDIQLLKHLALGYSKDQINSLFKKNNISPNSVSSIEKRQNKLLIKFKATNATHLVSIAKDLGLI